MWCPIFMRDHIFNSQLLLFVFTKSRSTWETALVHSPVKAVSSNSYFEPLTISISQKDVLF